MIISGLPETLPEINDPAFVKTMCAYKAYKDYDNIAQFWHQKDEQGNITSVISCINSYANLWSEKADKQELLTFFSFLSPLGVFTKKETALLLNFKIDEECLIFVKKPPFDIFSNNTQEEPRELLKILRQGLEIPDGDGFVADVAFRKYHGCAEYVTESGGGALLFMGDNSAIVNGIATPKENRSKGLGSILIKLLLSKAGNRTVFACCIEKNKAFYLKNGFSHIGYAAYCEEK